MNVLYSSKLSMHIYTQLADRPFSYFCMHTNNYTYLLNDQVASYVYVAIQLHNSQLHIIRYTVWVLAHIEDQILHDIANRSNNQVTIHLFSSGWCEGQCQSRCQQFYYLVGVNSHSVKRISGKNNYEILKAYIIGWDFFCIQVIYVIMKIVTPYINRPSLLSRSPVGQCTG